MIAALFSAVVAKADFNQTWTSEPTPWSSEVATDVPQGITNVFNSTVADPQHTGGEGHTIHMATINAISEGGDATISFTYTSGAHQLIVLGVDLVDSDGQVVKYHYELKGAGGDRKAEVYTLSDVPAGEYVMRYFVCDKEEDHEIDRTNGNITVTGLLKGFTEEDMKELLVEAKQANLIPTSGCPLGYPVEDAETRTTLATCIANAENDMTSKEACAALETALAAFYAETDVVLPEEGKAYKITAWWKNKQWPMTWSAADEFYKPIADAEEAVFVCKVVDDKYVFVSDNGYYLGWEADSKTGTTSNTYAENQQWTISKADLVPASGSITGLSIKDLLGKFCLSANGLVMDVNGETGNHNLMYNGEKYVNGQPGSKYYAETSWTTYFTLAEVSDYTTNTFSVKATSTVGETCAATFFAPYATALPEGYTAYTANNIEGETVKLVQLPGDIPANTAVVVTGPAAETVKVSLSTTNPEAVEDNKLFGFATSTAVAGSSYTATGADGSVYVLANGDDGVAFYHYTGENYVGGKAYLNAGVAAGARSLIFNFGGDTETAIESIQSAEGAKAVVYDLAGRRVQGAQKGLYIVNGKVVIK